MLRFRPTILWGTLPLTLAVGYCVATRLTQPAEPTQTLQSLPESGRDVLEGRRLGYVEALSEADRVLAETGSSHGTAAVPDRVDVFAADEWSRFPRERPQWVFMTILSDPKSLTADRLVRSEVLNPPDVTVGREHYAALERIAGAHRATLTKLNGIIWEAHAQEVSDLVATGLAPAVTPASVDNLSPDEKQAFDGWVVLFTGRMKENPGLVDMWGTPERMALEKVSEARAGNTASRNAAGQWYRVPREKMVRTKEVDDRAEQARRVCLEELTQWSERALLSSQADTVRSFAAYDALRARVEASRK